MHWRLQIQARRPLHRLFNEQGSEEDFQITEKGPHEAGLHNNAVCPAGSSWRLRPLGKSLRPQVSKGNTLADSGNLNLLWPRGGYEASRRISRGSDHAQYKGLRSACHRGRQLHRSRRQASQLEFPEPEASWRSFHGRLHDRHAR